MILDHTGRPFASPSPAADPRQPVALKRKPDAASSELARKMTVAHTQVHKDGIRIGVYLKRRDSDRQLFQIGPAMLQEFAGMIRRERLTYCSCFVETRDRIGEVFGPWNRDADLSKFADQDFRRHLPAECVEEKT